ncbi:MAG: endonuclease domain-containing protein [Xanthomonadales bacterium]|nr:endonuclease domain-containing protein [Xanthomonadales bacterium]
MSIDTPRDAQTFHFVRADYDAASACAALVYRFDDGPELTETIRFADAALAIPTGREAAFATALRLLHLIAGISYYKAAVPPQIVVDGAPLDAALAALLDEIYLHGLGEFAHRNGLDLRGRIDFPHDTHVPHVAARVGLPRRTLVPIGGGKDSLVTVELLRAAHEPMTAAWVGRSPLIAACVERSGLPRLNIERQISPLLFEMNRNGAWNGHIPVTAINSAILVCAAILHGHDAIAFSNERSASSANLVHDGFAVNHQWSKSIDFERAFRSYVSTRVAADLDYFSVLRPLSELAVTRLFAPLTQYHDVFSSCNRNFRILGDKPAERWCGQCPKCHFVFLALSPFLPKTRLVAIFGRNLLDDATLAADFDALLEVGAHKPFECVGEGRESRAAMAALGDRAEWREDALVARFRAEILPMLDRTALELAPLMNADGPHHLPARLDRVFDALG